MARQRWIAFCMAGLTLATACPEGAAAQEARLRGDYVVTLLGLTIGRGSWDVRIAPDHFIVTGDGRSAGVAVLISAGSGKAGADGEMRSGRPVGQRYDYSSTTSRKYDEIHFRLHDGTVSDLQLDPPASKGRKRVQLEPSHKEGVADPISAVLMPSAGPIGPESCTRDLRVFDGRMRYDLRFSFKRMEEVKTDSGYQGPVAVCAFRFVPIAGYAPDRPAIKYLIGLTTMEAWLAPVAGAGIVVPWKVVIPTPFGNGVLQAESFHVSQP